MLANTRTTYGLVAQVLHWLTALLILTLLGLGLVMGYLPESTSEEVARKFFFFSLHKTIGITTFAVAGIRVIWAIVQPHPNPLNSDKKLESLAAQTVHWTLYGAIILMPVTGWLHHAATEGLAPIWWPFSQNLPFVPDSPQLASVFGLAHAGTAILLGVALFLHVGGALKHALVDRDDTLRRMVPGSYRSPPAGIPDPHYKRLPAALAVLLFAILGVSVTGYLDAGRPGTRLTPQSAGSAKSAWAIDAEKSRLGIEVIVQGAPIAGHFQNWDAQIVFDPDNIKAASVNVRIDVPSLSLGGVTSQALASDYLNAEAHPVSTFASETFVKTGDTRYEARGSLTLAGKTKPLTLPFELKIEGGRAIMDAEVTINRLDFGIGPDQPLVGLPVKIKVSLQAAPSP